MKGQAGPAAATPRHRRGSTSLPRRAPRCAHTRRGARASARPWKTAAFSRYFGGDSIRTDRYLYTEWTDDAGQRTARMLYDHQADPNENVNIAERPDLADTVAGLARLLRAGWREQPAEAKPGPE